MKLHYHLMIRVLIPLIIGLLACAIVSIVPFYTQIPTWSNNDKQFMKVTTETMTNTRTINIVNILNKIFGQVINDMNTFYNYTESALTNELPVNKYYSTYVAQTSIDSRISPNDFYGFS